MSIINQKRIKMNRKVIMLDAGHGVDTAGKRSPEWEKGTLYEWEFNRDIVSRIAEILKASGYRYYIITTEDNDVELSERVRRINEYYNQYNNSFVVSIHSNAGGGEGYELFTSTGNTRSDNYAKIIYDEARKHFPEWKMRGMKEEQFYILRKTACPAILCELGFMDNRLDYDRLMSNECRNRLAIAHASALIKIASTYE